MGLFTLGNGYSAPKTNTDQTKSVAQTLAKYEAELEEYKKVLKGYQGQMDKGNALVEECRKRVEESRALILEYQERVVEDEKEEPKEEDQMAAVQVALDLTYIKEELDQIRQLEDDVLTKQIHELKDKQDDVMKRLSSINTGASSMEPIRRQVESGNATMTEALKSLQALIGKKNKGVRTMLVVSIILNLLLSGGIGFMIYYFCYYLVP